MTTVNVQRKHWRNVVLLAGAGLAVSSLTALPAPSNAAAPESKAGCCEAKVMWSGGVQELLVLTDRNVLKKSIPPDYGPFGSLAKYYLPTGKKVRTTAVLGGNSTTSASRARYRWEIQCLTPSRYRKSTKWTWTNVPAGPSKDPAAPIVPVKSVYGEVNTERCTSGNMWFLYDQGDPRYGKAHHYQFVNGPKHPVPAGLTVWKWVSKGQATTVARTGKYPVPKGTTLGEYFFTNRAYADKVAKIFPGHRLVRGTLPASDLMFRFTENRTSGTGIVGGFFRKQLTQPKRTFTVVR
ncbi:hypothetical protein [Spirillospora sp. CA-294931]|uniref:hypothetical protein n=1 Tax=Spirillospora sp. CA-294931 TaxID=3240042 RepID=UPI003D8E735E